MGILARAEPKALERRLKAFGPEPEAVWLRPPETGSVMVRGRAGGTGAAFNFGEVTATRCAMRLPDGTEGHALVRGRDAEHARRAAWADAMLQGRDAERVMAGVVEPLRLEETRRREGVARRAEATRVDFETLVRGEDA